MNFGIQLFLLLFNIAVEQAEIYRRLYHEVAHWWNSLMVVFNVQGEYSVMIQDVWMMCTFLRSLQSTPDDPKISVLCTTVTDANICYAQACILTTLEYHEDICWKVSAKWCQNSCTSAVPSGTGK